MEENVLYRSAHLQHTVDRKRVQTCDAQQRTQRVRSQTSSVCLCCSAYVGLLAQLFRHRHLPGTEAVRG